MNKIISNARQILEEQYKMYPHGELSLRDYVETEFENDPDSFFWLFNAVGEEDFDTSLNEEQRNAYNEFLETL